LSVKTTRGTRKAGGGRTVSKKDGFPKSSREKRVRAGTKAEGPSSDIAETRGLAMKKSKRGLRFQLQPGTRFLCRVVRKTLGLSQKEMSELMGVSKKTIESYEQRWRATPVNVERLALLYLGCFKLAEKNEKVQCWRMTKCPKPRREACVVYKVKRGDLCWMFGGAPPEEEDGQTDWRAKFERCMQCKVLRAIFE